MTDNPRPLLYGAHHPADLIASAATGAPAPATLAGRSCENDEIGEYVLPRRRRGRRFDRDALYRRLHVQHGEQLQPLRQTGRRVRPRRHARGASYAPNPTPTPREVTLRKNGRSQQFCTIACAALESPTRIAVSQTYATISRPSRSRVHRPGGANCFYRSVSMSPSSRRPMTSLRCRAAPRSRRPWSTRAARPKAPSLQRT